MKLFTHKAFITLGLCAATVFSTVSVQANEAADYYLRYLNNRFFPTHLTAKSMGLGGGYVALKDGSLGVVGNPATLGGISSGDVSLSYQYEEILGEDPNTLTDAEQSIHRGLILGAYPLTPQLGLGLGVVPDTADGDGAPDADTIQVPFGIGYQFNDQFSVGYGLGYYDDEFDSAGFDGENEEAFLHRFGLFFTPDPDVDFGLLGTFGHGDSDTSFTTGPSFDGDLEQWGIRGGMNWQFIERAHLVTDLGYQSMDSDGVITVAGVPGAVPVSFMEEVNVLTFTTGVEYYVNEKFQVRTGFGLDYYDYDSSDATLQSALDEETLFNWAGGLSYAWSEAIGTDVGFQVRFSDDVDFLTGITTSVSF